METGVSELDKFVDVSSILDAGLGRLTSESSTCITDTGPTVVVKSLV
jgi:hypothetical protein